MNNTQGYSMPFMRSLQAEEKGTVIRKPNINLNETSITLQKIIYYPQFINEEVGSEKASYLPRAAQSSQGAGL